MAALTALDRAAHFETGPSSTLPLPMSSKQIMTAAMRLHQPERVPVHCQLSIGHILLNTNCSHFDFNFSSLSFAEALLRIRDFYDFDGILLHKPGRDHEWQQRCDEVLRETAGDDGTHENVIVRWRDGGRTELPYNDDPKFYPPADCRNPAIDAVEVSRPLEGIPESLRHFWIYKGMFDWDAPDSFPDFYFEAIDHCQEVAGAEHQIHGEVKAPTDAVLNLLGLQEGLMAFITDSDRVHLLLEYFTPRLAAWAVAQARRGCDAIKISSPYAGGSFLSPEMYDEFVVPYERQIARAVKAEGTFVYTHTCGRIGDRLEKMVSTGIDGIECLDPPPLGDVEIEEAVGQIGGRIFIKGNLDSVNVLLRGSAEKVESETLRCLRAGSEAGGFILSSACSVAPMVPPENIKRMVEVARKYQPE